jgi:hypothetical protein
MLKIFRMKKFKEPLTLVAIGTKLSREEKGENVYPTSFKRLVGTLIYLTTTRLDIM